MYSIAGGYLMADKMLTVVQLVQRVLQNAHAPRRLLTVTEKQSVSAMYSKRVRQS